MWATTIDKQKGIYKLDNIPVYAPAASGDIVLAEYDNTENKLTYKYTIAFSGNSTIQVVLLEESYMTNDIRNLFNVLECRTEKFKEGYFVIEINAEKDYKPVRQKLSELREQGIIDYTESCLSERHWY